MLIGVGIIAIIYASMVVYVTIKRPEKIWTMERVQFFEKRFGPNNTIILFYIWAFAFYFLGFWLMSQ